MAIECLAASLSRLPPAHYLVASAAGVRTERYWDLPYRPKARVDEREALVEFRSIFEESVRLRLISDVPLGAFLSGGIDSAATVAAMSLEASGGVETFSIGFDDPRYDELPGARLVADRFHTRHHEFVVRPQAASIVDTLAWHYGEPFADSSAVPSYYLAELARKEITVALTGDGGDESFAGYRRYGAHRLATRLRAVPRPVLRTLARTVALLPAAERTRSRLYDVRRFVAALAAETGERYRGWFGFFDPDSPVVAADLRRAHGRVAAERLGAWFDRLRDEDPVDQAMGVDLTKYKVRAFVFSSFFAGVAGGLYALDIGAISAGDLNFIKSFDIIIMVVLGGLGSISGAVLAAVILSILPEALRDFQSYRLIVYALLLIVIMIVRPQGLFGVREVWDLKIFKRRGGGLGGSAGGAP